MFPDNEAKRIEAILELARILERLAAPSVYTAGSDKDEKKISPEELKLISGVMNHINSLHADQTEQAPLTKGDVRRFAAKADFLVRMKALASLSNLVKKFERLGVGERDLVRDEGQERFLTVEKVEWLENETMLIHAREFKGQELKGEWRPMIRSPW